MQQELRDDKEEVIEEDDSKKRAMDEVEKILSRQMESDDNK